MPRFQHIAYIVLISSLLFGHTPASNSREAIPVTYRAEFKPFGDGFTRKQVIPPDGGALSLNIELVLSPGTVTAEVAGDILFYEHNRTIRLQGKGGHLSSDGGIVLKGDIVMDFILPLPEAFFEEDDEPHIQQSIPIPGLNIDKGWNESVQFNSFLLNGNSVKLDIGIPELVTLKLSAVKIVPVVAATILSGGTATVAAKAFAESISDYLDMGIRLNGGLVSELTLAGKAVTVNGTPITVEGPPIRAPGFDPAVETYELQSNYDEAFTYTLDFVASGSAYARVAVLFGIEIWSYNNRFAEERISIIPASGYDLNFGGPATSATIDVPQRSSSTQTEVVRGGVIRDGNLASAIRHELRGTPSEIPWDEPITRNDMLGLTRLYAGSLSVVRSLIGLEHAVNLRELGLSNNAISNVSRLSGLTNLTRLELNNNVLSAVSLSNLPNLTTLNLRGNPLSTVSLSNLPNLTRLELNNNVFSAVSLSGLTSLTKLGLYNTSLSELSLSNLPRLESLGLHNTSPSAVSLSGLTSLTKLGLSNTSLSELSLSNLPRLESLWLSNTSLSELSLPNLPNLTILRLNNNSLSELSLSNLPNLTTLYINNNSLSELSLPNLPNLTTLHLQNNSLSELSLSNLPNLTYLYINNNSLSELSLPNLPSLESLWLNSNSLSEVSLPNLPNLTILRLNNNSLSELSLPNLPNLTRLDLHNNSLSELSLSNLPNLTTLHLQNNALSELSLSNLPNLTSLGFHHNSLSAVSLSGLTNLKNLSLGGRSSVLSEVSLSNLPSLTYLYLRHNSLSAVSLSGLTSLTTLHLENNAISDVSHLAGLTNLTTLHLQNNAISDVSYLAGLTNLTTLHLENNAISDVSHLAGLTNLTTLYLWGNPLNDASRYVHIPAMRARGIQVSFDEPAYPILVKISGEDQIGAPGAALPNPFVVQVLGAEDKPISGVSIRFAVYQGRGTLSTTTTTTDATGKAQTTLMLGPNPGTNKVAVIADGFDAVSFIATAREPEQIVEDPNGDSAPPERIAGDANGDGVVDILDLTLVGSNLGQQGATAADVNGDGVVNIKDLVLVSGAISNAAAAPAAGSGGEQ